LFPKQHLTLVSRLRRPTRAAQTTACSANHHPHQRHRLLDPFGQLWSLGRVESNSGTLSHTKHYEQFRQSNTTDEPLQDGRCEEDVPRYFRLTGWGSTNPSSRNSLVCPLSAIACIVEWWSCPHYGGHVLDAPTAPVTFHSHLLFTEVSNAGCSTTISSED
jgi:hypothetical protein